ncbi:RabGAP/TBC [Laetiporus sulphureus 93-53]|uniref:RabGAP/TBC n=1 Tax=Laetiporus sulphureus 93-53 TaxID=1314785 RepID=A0A165HDL3_9APHY|nr:RabGAP/TBC [Laetiporus sulphureus 93-53]KZT11595.1 RabGAP/TBC [Laetiporus sulphureus 93-53]
MAERRTRPEVQKIKDAYDHLFHSALSLSKIKDAALGGRLFCAADDTPGVPGRSLAWKLFLVQAEPLQTPAVVGAVPPLEALRAGRKEYTALLLEKMRAPDGSYEEGLIIPGTGSSPPRIQQSRQDLEKNNPLSLDDQNPWTEWFASVELRKTILQDVERTFPDIGYFRDAEVQTQLTNILYIYSVMHPDIGYRQGMHELLAPLYYAVDFDSIDEGNADLDDSDVEEFCSRAWVAADAWMLFASVMKGVGRWYEWQESKTVTEKLPLASHVQLNVSSGGNTLKPYVAPIVEACNRIQSIYLKSVDPELWKSMQNAGIEPQIYGIRWLRLLFTREFDMHDSMIIWDGLFACDPTFDLAQWICVAMLIRIRNKLIPSDYSGQLTYLLRYPSPPSLSQSSSDKLTIHRANLLLRQALTLQMSPGLATGLSIINENRNMLNIPVEVPEPPPAPPTRRSRPGERSSFSTSSSTRASSRGPISRLNHARQQSTPLGLPEAWARGLLERGESLGINKTVMNAVSELKRNLPDLTTSLGLLPLSPPQSTYAAYPLVDERPPSERSLWEHPSRFEVEREVSDRRALQRRLGDSVAWIVDTLLQDEESVRDENQKKTVRNRKREAVECLAYVRDVLKGTVTDVDEERLVSEEEFKRRKELRKQQEKEKEESRNRQRAAPLVPQPAATASPVQIASHRPRGSTDSLLRQMTAGSPSRSAIHTSPSQPSLHVSSSLPPNPSALRQNADAKVVAPWNFTRSDFSSRESPIATLPRVPPPTSTALRPQPATSAFSPLAPVSKQQRATSPDQAPRTVQQDPLGALS